MAGLLIKLAQKKEEKMKEQAGGCPGTLHSVHSVRTVVLFCHSMLGGRQNSLVIFRAGLTPETWHINWDEQLWQWTKLAVATVCVAMKRGYFLQTHKGRVQWQERTWFHYCPMHHAGSDYAYLFDLSRVMFVTGWKRTKHQIRVPQNAKSTVQKQLQGKPNVQKTFYCSLKIHTFHSINGLLMGCMYVFLCKSINSGKSVEAILWL